MEIEELTLKGAFYIEPKIHSDHRGYFFEWFNTKEFQEQSGVIFNPVQFNYSKSSKGVLRGLHFQQTPFAQAKVVSVTRGEVQDVIVDLRKGSPTFGQSCSLILNSTIRNQVFIPKGFAHGFLVLSDEAEIFYAIDEFYSPESESGLPFDDKKLNIDWMIPHNQIILSEKDKVYRSLKETSLNFNFDV